MHYIPIFIVFLLIRLSLIGGAFEYTDCNTVERLGLPHNWCTGYDTKVTDAMYPILEL